MDIVRMTIPWAYIVPDNRRYGLAAGRIVLSRRYRAAKGAVHLLALGQVARPRPRFPAEPVRLHVDLYAPDRRRRDLQNLAKLLCDALQGTVYADDAQIAEITWKHCGVDRENPRVEINASAIDCA